MRIVRLTTFGFALLCLFLSHSSASAQPAGQNQPTQSQTEYCQAQSSDGATIYFSDVFEADLPYKIIAAGGIENLFGAYLEKSYRYKSQLATPVVCAIGQNSAASEENKKQVQAGYTMRGKPFVETRWKLSRQQAAALAAAPPPKTCNLSHGETGPCPQTSEFRKSYCYSDPFNKQPTMPFYFSDIFDTNIPLGASSSSEPIQAAFYAYLKQAHAYTSTSGFPTQCVLFDSVAAAEASKQQLQGGYKNGNYRIVETKWKLSSQQVNTAAPALAAVVANAPAPAASGTSAAANPTASSAVYGFCSASMGGYEYFSAPFAGTAETSRSWVYAFAEYLKQKYDYKGFATCPTTQSLAEAQAQLKNMVDSARGISYAKVFETGWVYTAAASPPASPASPPAASSDPITSYTVCVAGDASTSYVSAAFAVTKMDDPAWRNAFAQFLAQKYSYKGGVGCNNMDLEHAPTFLKNRVAGLRANKKQVVETGWTYGSSATASATPTRPSTAAPTAPGPPAAAVAITTSKVTHAVCWADFDPHTRYYSAVFDGTAGDYNVWMPAFKTFLEQKYHYTGLVRCTKRPDKADAQKYLDNMVSTARGMTLGDGSKAKVIETSWQYK